MPAPSLSQVFFKHVIPLGMHCLTAELSASRRVKVPTLHSVCGLAVYRYTGILGGRKAYPLTGTYYKDFNSSGISTLKYEKLKSKRSLIM